MIGQMNQRTAPNGRWTMSEEPELIVRSRSMLDYRIKELEQQLAEAREVLIEAEAEIVAWCVIHPEQRAESMVTRLMKYNAANPEDE